MNHSEHPARKPAPEAKAQRRRKAPETAKPVSPVLARQIDENLKRLYRQQVEQELPPELQALVAQLRNGEDKG